MEKASLFTQEIYTECTIDAAVAEVYSIISDFTNYATWENELIVTGMTQPGGKMLVKVKTAKNGQAWITLSATMTHNDQRMIAFDNVLLAPFLFRGRHRFELVPIQDNRTLFINAELFSGLAVPFVRKKTLMVTTREFKDHINLALKLETEARCKS